MRVAIGAGLLLLAGCAPVPPPPPAPGGDACGAGARAGLFLAPAAAAEGLTASGGVRVIRPGEGVAPGYRPDRLNIEIDPLGRIVGIRCG